MRRPIPGHAGYEADSDGNIWSVASNWRGYGTRILKTKEWKDGYLVVHLNVVVGKKHPFTVHTLVCSAFRGPRPKGKQCRHLDGVKINNHWKNLQWGTAKENADDRRIHGTHRVGIDCPWTKLNPDSVRHIRRLLDDGMEQAVIGALYGVTQSAVSLIKLGKNWKEVI